MSPWYEDYYAGSSDYPICHESAEEVYLTEDHEEPPESARVGQLREALPHLTDKQRFVVECSWGLRGEECYSFQEIADVMGVKQQSVADTYGRAMAALRRGLLVSPNR